MALAFALEPGPYALSVDVATDADVPMVGTKRVHTRSLLFAELVVDDGEWVLQQQTCAIDVRGGGPASTYMPPAFVSALPVQRVPLRVRDGRVVADGGPVTIGARPDLPLPQTLEDEGLVDFDGDGHPGATVWVDVPVFGRVKLFVVQRAHAVLDGVVTATGASGQVRTLSMDQRTLGGTRRLFVANPRITPVDEDSHFELVQIEGSGCADVLALSWPEPGE